MTLRFGEVVLIRMQFHQTTGVKIRPAVVLLDTGDDDFVAAPITSQLRHTDYDLFLEDWRAAGLNVASCVRVHKLSVLPKADIVRSWRAFRRKTRTHSEIICCAPFLQGH